MTTSWAGPDAHGWAGIDRPAPTAAQAPAWHHPQYLPAAAQQGTPSNAGRAIALVLLGLVFTVAGVISLAIWLFSLGVAGFLVGLVLSLIPLTIVVGSFVGLDRWEPEPRRTLVIAFIYGGLIAGLLAGIANSLTDALIELATSRSVANLTTPVLVAPVVEESLKGLGVLVIALVMARKHYTSVIDCVVLAGMVAAGFAFVENIDYIGGAFIGEGLQDSTRGMALNATTTTIITFIFRGLLSPFAHPLFTGMTGLAIGLAMGPWKARFGAAAWLAVPGGLFLAMTLHGLWNLGWAFGMVGLLVYGLLMVPVFITMVVVVVLLRQREARRLVGVLAGYQQARWLSPADVHMMSTLASRRQARRWAAGRLGPAGASTMAAYQQMLTCLAGLRLAGTPAFTRQPFPAREQELLHQVRNHQHQLGLM